MEGATDQNTATPRTAGPGQADVPPRPAHRASSAYERAPWTKPVVDVVETGLEVTAYIASD
jgi:coenzyme PQQ precursor peptide PqqA